MRELARRAGASGWFQDDLLPRSPSRYREHFHPVELEDRDFSCPAVPDGGRIVVVVHGLEGDREEMERALPSLLASQPSALFMYRWLPYEERASLVRRLARGLSHLGACAPQARVLVVAHSAGGVLVSEAVGHVRVRYRGGEPWLTVLTVASPLAGTAQVPPRDDGRDEALFLFDLAHAIDDYPAAPPGVRVVHLRTRAPADRFMVPVHGHVANDPGVGVPGARQVELPAQLDHDAALAYVAGRIADGTWTQWTRPPEAITAQP